MSNIQVEKEIQMRKISDIKPYVRNPRKNDKTVELLCKIIPKVGFNVPLVIDENGIIVKGHARFAAAIRLGMTELPCIVSHADAEAIRADRIADNKISEFSEWVNDEVMHEIDAINFDFDFSELGFETTHWDDLPSPDNWEPETDSESTATGEISAEERERLYKEFLERQAKESAPAVEIASERALNAAQEAQRKMGDAGEKYYKCVCEKCGHVMFVREGDLIER